MIKKKPQTNKMVKQDKVVYQCILCNYRYIGDAILSQCPACKNKETFAINGSFIVTKGV